MAGSPMRLQQKLAWLCGTGVFALLTCTSVFRQIDILSVMQGNSSALEPVSALLLSLLGGVAGGALGYMMGDILSRPKGNHKAKKGRKTGRDGMKVGKTAKVTGGETFLDDLTTPAEGPDQAKIPPEAALETPLAAYDTPATENTQQQQPLS